MKKKVLLSSIATIALCLCLIAGSTFALFTDTTNFNIAVTSGDVEIEAYATINSVWSAYGDGVAAAEDEYLIDENGHFYAHGKRDPIEGRYIFTNGGEAKLDGKNLVINRITPGDRVDIDINITNKSDVAFAYRYKLISNNTNLATGMVVTIDDVSYESLAIWTSKWYPVITAPNGTPSNVPVKTISIELPVYAGNEYQGEKEAQEDGRPAGEQSVEYTIIVEAVQGNAVTDDESEIVIYQTEPVKSSALVVDEYQGEIFDEPMEDVVLVKDLYLTGKGNVTVDPTYSTVVIENVTADVDGDVLNTEYSNTFIISDATFFLDDGEAILTVNDNLPSQQIILQNVYVVTVDGNGVESTTLITRTNVYDYIVMSNPSMHTVMIYNN